MQSALPARPRFQDIVDHHIAAYRRGGSWSIFCSLQNGTAVIGTRAQADTYLAAYGEMHRLKLESAFGRMVAAQPLPGGTGVEVVDWGCGQALASCVLAEWLRDRHPQVRIRRITLIDPSAQAVERGAAHLELLLGGSTPVRLAVAGVEGIAPEQIATQPGAVKIHLFSNWLDMETVDYRRVAALVRETQRGDNLLVCVSPRIHAGRDRRLHDFRNLFAQARLLAASTEPIQATVFRLKSGRHESYAVTRNDCLFSIHLPAGPLCALGAAGGFADDEQSGAQANFVTRTS